MMTELLDKLDAYVKETDELIALLKSQRDSAREMVRILINMLPMRERDQLEKPDWLK